MSRGKGLCLRQDREMDPDALTDQRDQELRLFVEMLED